MRFSELVRELKRPDKTVYVALNGLQSERLIKKERDRGYLITKKGKATLARLEYSNTVDALFRKLGVERAAKVKSTLDELLGGGLPESRLREVTRRLVGIFDEGQSSSARDNGTEHFALVPR
jgi:DNA-binding PadR family transcriptional regulator